MAKLREQKLLVVESEGGFPVYQIKGFLATLDAASNYIYVAHRLLINAEFRKEVLADVRENIPRRYGRSVPRGARLRVKSVELHSPGSWIFEGSAKILEQIRLYINDLHERKKDKSYRNAADKKRLKQESDLRDAELATKRLDLLKDQIKLARELGATDADIQLIVEKFISTPLKKLNKFERQGLLGGARIEDTFENDGDGQKKP